MNEAKAILKEYGQEQLLRFYDELSDTEKKELLDQIKSTDFSVIEKSIKAMAEDNAPRINNDTPVKDITFV